MKKSILIGAVAAGVLLIVLVLGLISGKGKKVNRELDLIVETNPIALYEWGYEIEDKSIVRYNGSYPLKEEKNIDGDNKKEITDEELQNETIKEKDFELTEPVKIKFKFEGLKKGTTKIKIYYYNVLTNEISTEKNYKVKVSSNKSISLIK